MPLFSYPANFTTGSDGRVLVEFIDLPCVATDSKDERDAMEEAINALGSDLSIRLSHPEVIPTSSPTKRNQRLVPVSLWLAPKLLLYLKMRDRRMSNSELASPPEPARAGNPPHARSQTRPQGREDPSRPRGPWQAHDR